MPSVQDGITETPQLSIDGPRAAGRRSQSLWGSVALWAVFSILAAAALSWDGRLAMNPDGLSYLEMASNTVAQGPSHLLNSYWSPLYPTLLMSVYLFHPTPNKEQFSFLE